MLLTKKQSSKLGKMADDFRKEILRLYDATIPFSDGDKWIGVYAVDIAKIDKLIEVINEDSGLLTTRGNHDFMKNDAVGDI